MSHLINAAFRLKHVPILWNTAEVIIIRNQGKHDVKSYACKSILSLVMLPKLFQKWFLRKWIKEHVKIKTKQLKVEKMKERVLAVGKMHLAFNQT